MKRYLLCLIGIWACTSICSAQEYHPLLRPNVYWDVAYAAGVPVCTFVSVKSYFFEGDTLIDGQTYQKSYYYTFDSHYPNDYCPPFRINTTTKHLTHFWREDTLERQVFRYVLNWGGGGEEILVYDFGLAIGDTLSDRSAGTFVLSTIDSIQLTNGEYRKRFSFDDVSDNRLFAYYVEGVGGSEGLINPLAIALGSWSYIMCMRENGQSIYEWECNYLSVDLEETLPIPSLRLYPNPTTDLVHVEYPGQKIQIWLLDQTGKVLDHQMGRNELEFDLQRYPAGIYLLRIWDEKHQVIGSRKIMYSP